MLANTRLNTPIFCQNDMSWIAGISTLALGGSSLMLLLLRRFCACDRSIHCLANARGRRPRLPALHQFDHDQVLGHVSADNVANFITYIKSFPIVKEFDELIDWATERMKKENLILDSNMNKHVKYQVEDVKSKEELEQKLFPFIMDSPEEVKWLLKNYDG